MAETRRKKDLDETCNSAGHEKPKSRLLMMKERLKTQRQKQVEHLSKGISPSVTSSPHSNQSTTKKPVSSTLVACNSTTSGEVPASPVRGRRFQRLKAVEASRSVSQIRNALPQDGILKKSMTKSKSQEIHLEKSPESALLKQTSLVTLGRVHLSHNGPSDGDKVGRKGSLLARSQSFLARLSFRSHTKKDKVSTTSLVKDVPPGSAVHEASDINLKNSSVSFSSNSIVNRDYDQNSNVKNTVRQNFDTYQISDRKVAPTMTDVTAKFCVDNSKIKVTNAACSNVDSQIEDGRIPGMHLDRYLSLVPEFPVDKSAKTRNCCLSGTFECSYHCQCQRIMGGGTTPLPCTMSDDRTEGCRCGNENSCRRNVSFCEQNSADYSNSHNIGSVVDEIQFPPELRQDSISSERGFGNPQEIHICCTCRDVNCVASGMYRSLSSPLGPDNQNFQSSDSPPTGITKTSAPQRTGSASIRGVVKRLSDIPEELAPCQTKTHNDGVDTDINRNITRKNMSLERRSPFMTDIPKANVKKGRSGSIKVTNQEPKMSDQKFPHCHSATLIQQRTGHEERKNADSFPPDYETAQTLCGFSADNVEPTPSPSPFLGEDQKTALLDHLAQKYPTHANTIRSTTGSIYDSGTIRRRGISSAMHGSQSSVHQSERMVTSSCCEMDAGSPASSSSLGSCRELRSTLPVVRSPNKSMERPLGQVFLVYRGETKRAVLPNEVTSIDTVRALFVRSFPKSLSMRWFDSPYRKIYILDPTTNVFYELEELCEIKDRIILKIYEHSECLTLASPRALQQQRPNCDTVSRTGLMNFKASTSSFGQSTSTCTSPQSMMESTHSSLPSASSSSIPQMHSSQQSITLPQQHATNQWSYITQSCLSPSRGPAANQRHSVACLPDPASCSNTVHMTQSHSCQDYADRDLPLSAYSSGTITPSGGDAETKNRMQKMESQLASLTAWVQTTMHKQSKTDSSLSNIPRSAILSVPNSVKSSASDISTCTPQPAMSVTMLNIIYSLRNQADEMRSELSQLRHMQVAYASCMKIAVQNVFEKIKLALVVVPELQRLPCSRTRRFGAEVDLQNHRIVTEHVNEGLRDLDQLVEEIRKDVVGRKCRVNMAEVESLALALSHISRSLADLKSGFPELHSKLKSVMETEMENVVHEEKFLREEPLRIEESLKKSKKLMGTLLTLKKLASVQEKRPVAIPSVATKQEVTSQDRQAVLLSIEAMKPNHEARMQSLEDAAAARERKKKITGNIETLRFEKTLELAQRQLRETDNMARNAARQEQILSLIYQQSSTTLTSDDKTGAKDHSPDLSDPTTEMTDSVFSPSLELDRLPIDDHVLVSPRRLEQVKMTVDSESFSLGSELADLNRTDSVIVGTENTMHLVTSNSSCNVPTLTSAGGETINKLNNSAISLSSPSHVEGICENHISTSSAEINLPTADVEPVESSANGPSENALNSDDAAVSSVGIFSPSPMSPVSLTSHLVSLKTEAVIDSQVQPKKVAPPPPPRKTFGPPSVGDSVNGSGVIYENVDGCRQDSLEPFKASRPQSVFGISHRSESLLQSAKPRPTSEYSSSGLTAHASESEAVGVVKDSLNSGSKGVGEGGRPVTSQGSSVVEKLGIVCCQKESDSDSSASNDSQTGTIKRTPFTKEEPPGDNKLQRKPSNSNGNTSRIPPPVPLRKTSTLSAQSKTASPVAQHQYSNLQELRKERALLEKQSVVSKRPPRSGETPLANGNVILNQTALKTNRLNAGQNNKMDRRKCEETEIY